MKTTVKKAFLDIHKEEEWLNEQGQNGLMLIGYHSGEYEFEDVSPARYQYKIDLPAYTGSKKKEYCVSGADRDLRRGGVWRQGVSEEKCG